MMGQKLREPVFEGFSLFLVVVFCPVARERFLDRGAENIK